MNERAEHRIAEAVTILETMATLRARLRLIEEELEAYFPGDGQVEHVSTPFGTVHRIIQEDVYLDPKRAHEVMAHLGSQFSQAFTTKTCFRATPDLLKKVSDSGSFLGTWIRDYLVVERRRHFDFSPGTQVIEIPSEGTT